MILSGKSSWNVVLWLTIVYGLQSGRYRRGIEMLTAVDCRSDSSRCFTLQHRHPVSKDRLKKLLKLIEFVHRYGLSIMFYMLKTGLS